MYLSYVGSSRYISEYVFFRVIFLCSGKLRDLGPFSGRLTKALGIRSLRSFRVRFRFSLSATQHIHSSFRFKFASVTRDDKKIHYLGTTHIAKHERLKIRSLRIIYRFLCFLNHLLPRVTWYSVFSSEIAIPCFRNQYGVIVLRFEQPFITADDFDPIFCADYVIRIFEMQVRTKVSPFIMAAIGEM